MRVFLPAFPIFFTEINKFIVQLTRGRKQGSTVIYNQTKEMGTILVNILKLITVDDV
jgi:hypothetical protein